MTNHSSDKEIARREDDLDSMYKWLDRCDPINDLHLTKIIKAKIVELKNMAIPLINPHL